MTINKKLLEILVCPACKSKVKLNAKKDKLVCEKCKVIYDIIDSVPIMLVKKSEMPL